MEAKDKIIDISSNEKHCGAINDGIQEGSNTDESDETKDGSEGVQANTSETTEEFEGKNYVSEGSNTDGIDETKDGGEGAQANTSEITYELEEEDEVIEDSSLALVYDYGLIPAEKLSIPKVYDIKEDKIINSNQSIYY